MKFSVIIPVYNVKDYLEKCVQSVLKQSCTDYEMILVDDGSTDESGTLCDTIAAQTPEKIRVIHQANGGLGAARNTGIAQANGDYLIFLDSDDYLDCRALEGIAAKIDETQADIIIFDFCTDRDGDTSGVMRCHLPTERVFTLESDPTVLLEMPNTCNKSYRRDVFDGIAFPGRVWYEDIRTTPKLYAKAKSIAYLPQPYYYYVERSGSIMNNSKLARNREILDAFDDLLTYYQQHGLYERYREELCRMAVDHIFLAASVRVLKEDPKHPLLKEFYQYMQTHFPNFRSNRYLSQLSGSKKLAYTLLLHRQYRVLQLLFRIKDK